MIGNPTEGLKHAAGLVDDAHAAEAE